MHFALPYLFSGHAAASFDKQLHLADLVDEADWRFDLSMGLLSFGDHFHWQAQLVGTESEETQTWLWAWANEGSNIPPSLLLASLAMKALGQQRLIEELTELQFPLGEINGHFFSLLASGVCQAHAYYRAPYEGGAAFLLIKDDAFPRCTELPLRRITSVFPQAISSLDIHDHKQAFISYLTYYDLTFKENASQVVVEENGEPVLTAIFDEVNRLSNLEATLNRRQHQ